MADKPSAYAHGAASASSSTPSTSSTVFDSSPRPFNQFSSSPAPFFSSFHTNDARHPLPRHPTAMASHSPPLANAVANAVASTNNTSASANPNTSTHKPFASQTQMAPPAAPTKKLDISSLMSPPDAVMDSFHHARTNSSASVSTSMSPPTAEKHRLPMSPPISPHQRAAASHADSPATPPGQPVQDPVLYPHDDSATSSSPPQPPLFASAELEDHRRIIDDHVRAQDQVIFRNVTPPRIDDYQLALSFRSQVLKQYARSPRKWLQKERAYLEADKRANAGGQRYHAIMPARPVAAKPPRSHRADRVSKPHAAPRPRAGNNGGPSGAMRPTGRVSATPEPSRRVVAPNREDKDFNSLPDYCPPLDSLPSRANSLKVDWKGQPIDLSGDPHAHLLHPDEVTLAGNLRLDCATYLTSKRRIFERRLQCLRSGKEFRKTDAQQACKIDVNKASKLWTAFDKVGWLDAKWVQRFR